MANQNFGKTIITNHFAPDVIGANRPYNWATSFGIQQEVHQGVAVNTQDMAIQEGMGPICDRSKEFLGTSDKAIVAMRRSSGAGYRPERAGAPRRRSVCRSRAFRRLSNASAAHGRPA